MGTIDLSFWQFVGLFALTVLIVCGMASTEERIAKKFVAKLLIIGCTIVAVFTAFGY